MDSSNIDLNAYALFIGFIIIETS